MTDETKNPFLRRHLQVGWWGLLFFLSMGASLELLHGFKVGFYLDVSNETRAMLWTLAHAHGALISIVHVGFAATTALVPDWSGEDRTWASHCLIAALVLIPSGFFLGGLFIHGGDPGLGIFLLPPGAALLFAAVLLTARAAGSVPREAD